MRGLVYGCLAACRPRSDDGGDGEAPAAPARTRLLRAPPAELTAEVGLPHSPAATMVARFASDALTGALFGVHRRSPVPGAAFGVGVWPAS